MNRRSARRPAFPAIVVAFLVAAAGVALANDYEPVRPPPPEPGFTAPVLMVCRSTDPNTARPGLFGSCITGSDNLVNGELVEVTAGGFVANETGGQLQQCTLDLTLCETATVPFTTGSNAFSNPLGQPDGLDDPQVTPTPYVVKSTFVAAGGETVNCLVTACVIYATLNTQSVSLAACHGLTFVGGVASACTTAPTPTTSTSTSTSSTSTSTSTTVAPTTTSTSTSTTVAPTTTSTSTSTTVAPTTTSTSTSTTVAPTTTTSTSTSTTVAPTTTTSTSTSTTVAPTTTSTSTSTTVAPTTSTSTTVAPTTTTSTSTTSTSLPATTSTTTLSQCALLQQARARFNAQVVAGIAAVNASTLSAGQKAAIVARLQAVRAQGNSQIDRALAGCANPV